MESQLVTREAPDFGRLRKAKLSETPRMAIVAAAGFFHSEVFKYQKPLYPKFVADTVKNYYNFFLREIRNPNSIVLVVEDNFEKDERDSVYDALKVIYPPVKSADSVIVGVGIMSLPEGSDRSGQFQPEDVNDTQEEVLNLKRDESEVALSLYLEYTEPAKSRWFGSVPHMRLQTLVIHPRFQRRGHGKTITEWFKTISLLDSTPFGVSSAPGSKDFYSKLGFEIKEEVLVPGYEYRSGFTLYICTFQPIPANEEELAHRMGYNMESQEWRLIHKNWMNGVQPLLKSQVRGRLHDPPKRWSDITEEEIRALECKIAENEEVQPQYIKGWYIAEKEVSYNFIIRYCLKNVCEEGLQGFLA